MGRGPASARDPKHRPDTHASMSIGDFEGLERFIVDDVDLLALQESIGRFNIFDALSDARAEIRHSNSVAWQLTPTERHGQRALFLDALLVGTCSSEPRHRGGR